MKPYIVQVDAYPDIAGQTAWVITPYPGRAPEEVERQVTIPIEIAMRNVPQVEAVRSQTILGLSLVQLIFEEGTETYWARQRVQERLTSVELPQGVQPDLGPIVSPCGEIYRYELTSLSPRSTSSSSQPRSAGRKPISSRFRPAASR